jgi:hypothetical protein
MIWICWRILYTDIERKPLCCVTTIPHLRALPRIHWAPCSRRCWTIPHTFQPFHFMLSCAWPLQEDWQRAIDLVCTKVLSDSNINSRSSVQRGGFDLYVIGIPTRLPMWFLLLYSEKLPNASHLNKPHTGEMISTHVLGGCTVTCNSSVILSPQ